MKHYCKLKRDIESHIWWGHLKNFDDEGKAKKLSAILPAGHHIDDKPTEVTLLLLTIEDGSRVGGSNNSVQKFCLNYQRRQTHLKAL